MVSFPEMGLSPEASVLTSSCSSTSQERFPSLSLLQFSSYRAHDEWNSQILSLWFQDRQQQQQRVIEEKCISPLNSPFLVHIIDGFYLRHSPGYLFSNSGLVLFFKLHLRFPVFRSLFTRLMNDCRCG